MSLLEADRPEAAVMRCEHLSVAAPSLWGTQSCNTALDARTRRTHEDAFP